MKLPFNVDLNNKTVVVTAELEYLEALGLTL